MQQSRFVWQQCFLTGIVALLKGALHAYLALSILDMHNDMYNGLCSKQNLFVLTCYGDISSF